MIIKFDLGIRFWTDMADEDDDSPLLIPIFESNGSSFLKKKKTEVQCSLDFSELGEPAQTHVSLLMMFSKNT